MIWFSENDGEGESRDCEEELHITVLFSVCIVNDRRPSVKRYVFLFNDGWRRNRAHFSFLLRLFCRKKEKEACELMVRMLLFLCFFCTTILFINAGRNFKRMNAVRIRAVLILTKYNGNAATCIVKLIVF